MAVVRVASRRLSRIEVCSLYTETGAYTSAHTCALVYPRPSPRGKYGRRLTDRNSRDLSHVHGRRRGVRRNPLVIISDRRIEPAMKNLTEKLAANPRNANYLINSLEVCRRGWRATRSRFNESVGNSFGTQMRHAYRKLISPVVVCLIDKYKWESF